MLLTCSHGKSWAAYKYLISICTADIIVIAIIRLKFIPLAIWVLYMVSSQDQPYRDPRISEQLHDGLVIIMYLPCNTAIIAADGDYSSVQNWV